MSRVRILGTLSNRFLGAVAVHSAKSLRPYVTQRDVAVVLDTSSTAELGRVT